MKAIEDVMMNSDLGIYNSGTTTHSAKLLWGRVGYVWFGCYFHKIIEDRLFLRRLSCFRGQKRRNDLLIREILTFMYNTSDT